MSSQSSLEIVDNHDRPIQTDCREDWQLQTAESSKRPWVCMPRTKAGPKYGHHATEPHKFRPRRRYRRGKPLERNKDRPETAIFPLPLASNNAKPPSHISSSRVWYRNPASSTSVLPSQHSFSRSSPKWIHKLDFSMPSSHMWFDLKRKRRDGVSVEPLEEWEVVPSHRTRFLEHYPQTTNSSTTGSSIRFLGQGASERKPILLNTIIPPYPLPERVTRKFADAQRVQVISPRIAPAFLNRPVYHRPRSSPLSKRPLTTSDFLSPLATPPTIKPRPLPRPPFPGLATDATQPLSATNSLSGASHRAKRRPLPSLPSLEFSAMSSVRPV
jgi:hypothetical protein